MGYQCMYVEENKQLSSLLGLAAFLCVTFLAIAALSLDVFIINIQSLVDLCTKSGLILATIVWLVKFGCKSNDILTD